MLRIAEAFADCPAHALGKAATTSGRLRDWLPPAGARLAAFTHTRRQFPSIQLFLGAAPLGPLEFSFLARPDGVVAWSGGPFARLAKIYAEMRGMSFHWLEDGFLRSVGLGKAGARPVSMIADDLGLPFDARMPSRLERLLDDGRGDPTRGAALRALIVGERLTKYNHLPDRPLRLARTLRRRILLVDQVAGDRSVHGAGADASSFREMLATARAERGAELVVKIHPDVAAGHARGHLASLIRGETVVADAVSPHAVLDAVDEVWTVSSQLGLDALLRGLPVRTFGAPFWAGWGLSEDRATGELAERAFARRRRRPSIDEFTDTVVRRYALYCDPVTRRRVEPEAAIARLVGWRRRALDLAGTYLCVGFSRHKRAVARRFLEGPWSRVSFSSSPLTNARLRNADHIVVWGDKPAGRAGGHGRAVTRVEDGFVRSAGLGSDKVPPASLCFDPQGLYCDATRPSRLEGLLNMHVFDLELLERARRLRTALVAAGITKYNLPSGRSYPYRRLAAGRRIIVVAAQVPGDVSLRLGLALHAGNEALLAAVRLACPDAMVVYKDHPELVAGNRRGCISERRLRHHADLVVGNVDLAPLLEAADEVHVATSQLGFEALLRGRRVVCHGMPFYAGWGLTEDLVSPPRPRRRLSLDALVAGVLILYPAYVSSRTGLPCEVEDVLTELAAEPASLDGEWPWQ